MCESLLVSMLPPWQSLQSGTLGRVADFVLNLCDSLSRVSSTRLHCGQGAQNACTRQAGASQEEEGISSDMRWVLGPQHAAMSARDEAEVAAEGHPFQTMTVPVTSASRRLLLDR